MSEERAPYGARKKLSDQERIALFLNDFLGKESIMDIQYPTHLEKPYEEMTTAEREDFFSETFRFVFMETSQAVSWFMRRPLAVFELGLIRRRIVILLKSLGFQYSGE